jgi:hypothetical protein
MEFVVRRCHELYDATLEERRDAWHKCRVSINATRQSAQQSFSSLLEMFGSYPCRYMSA